MRGEITLILEAPGRAATPPSDAGVEKIGVRIARLQAEGGIDEKEALKRLARELGTSKSDLYRELQREKAKRPGR
jgi:16S rRNA (cytidine1402-2'-O)-methyltransferase